MPILAGSASLTRCNVALPSGGPELDSAPFLAISEGSEVRESIGFVPFEPGADYQIGHDRWAFRVRIDRLQPDPTAVRERFADLVRSELRDSNAEVLPANKRKELKHLAEEELLVEARPRSRILEGVIDGRTATIGTTANVHLGKVLLLLRKVGVLAELKTPWLDDGDETLDSEIMEVHDPTQSLHGSRFLKNLLGDRELLVEPVDGYVKLQTEDARVTLSGRVLGELHRYVDADCELLAAKLLSAETSFRLDALAFRISGLRLGRSRGGHWTERLDDRLEQIQEVWDLLDRKYRELRRQGSRPGSKPGRMAGRRAAAGEPPGKVVPFGAKQ